jgi:hypothetical protein
MHFDEQSFIRNLLTNERALQNTGGGGGGPLSHGIGGMFQSHDTLPGQQ